MHLLPGDIYYTGIILGIALGAIMGLRVGIWWHSDSVRKDLQNLRWYQQTILRQNGCTSLVPGVTNYAIASFDGGKNWYAVEDSTVEVREESKGRHTRDFELKILGPADEVYPGLLAHINGMNKLAAFAEKNGPITLSGSNVGEEIQVLKDAGFTVSKT